MPLDRRLCILAAALLAAILIPTLASAQSAQQRGLRWPTIAAGAAATADWATTYHALKFYKVQEQNPVLKPFQSTPGRLVSMGGMIDVAGISAWNLTVGPKHPKMAAAGLWTMTAFRAYLAIHNHINEHRSERR
jgi:hypothetical protein